MCCQHLLLSHLHKPPFHHSTTTATIAQSPTLCCLRHRSLSGIADTRHVRILNTEQDCSLVLGWAGRSNGSTILGLAWVGVSWARWSTSWTEVILIGNEWLRSVEELLAGEIFGEVLLFGKMPILVRKRCSWWETFACKLISYILC